MTAAIDRGSLAFVQQLLRAHAGMAVEDDKAYLVESRLLPLAQREGFSGIDELVARLRSQPTQELRRKVVEAMVIHETRFFRDLNSFRALRETVIPELIAARRSERTLQIWSGACASGQEPYSVAMLLRESFPELDGWKVRILATDISTQILERARAGRYSSVDVLRSPAAGLVRKHSQKRGDQWEVNDDIRRLVEFQQLNLAGTWPRLPQMDLVLLRNVLIYFDAETRRRIISTSHAVLREGGHLLLGTGETTGGGSEPFEPVLGGGALSYRRTLKL